jgi:FkbM family methyltransferase
VSPSARGWFPPSYEPGVCDYLRSRVRPGDVCFNVGAHVGVYALCLAEWSRSGGRVVAFEPNPPTRRVLADHVRRNGLRDRVTVESLAVGGAVGRATFVAVPLAGTSRIGTANPEAHLSHERFDVEVTTLDVYCEGRRLRPDWIVMDIEGFEVEALRGARATLAAGAGRIGVVVEMHPHLWELSGTSRAGMEAVLTELRLVARPLSGQRDPLAESGVVALEPAVSVPA